MLNYFINCKQRPFHLQIKNFANLFKNLWAFLLVLFLVFFPKGGIKLQGIPLTWGYGLLFLISFFQVTRWIACDRSFASLRKQHIFAYMTWFPFLMITILTAFFLGLDDSSLGFVFSHFITFALLPFIIYITLSSELETIDLKFLFKWLKRGVFFVSTYGIFLFIYRIINKSFLEIPFLTMNYGDMGMLDEKHIMRGIICKLISTYNNGNIYGVCIMMLLPLYDYLEYSIWKKAIVRVSILLTLSRTAWAGLLMYELMSRFFLGKISLKKLIYALLACLGAIAGFLGVVRILQFDMSFLYDVTLGGRAQIIIDAISSFSLLPKEPVGAIAEVVYLSVLQRMGLIGLLCFLFAMLYPLLLYKLQKIPYQRHVYKKSLLMGMLNYLILANIDGAILFIPVMVFYLFLNAFFLSANPSFLEKAS